MGNRDAAIFPSRDSKFPFRCLLVVTRVTPVTSHALWVLFRRNRVVLCYSGKIAGFYAVIWILCILCFCCEKLDYRKKMVIFAGE